MNQPDNILNELKELSPALAAIPKTNVFSVPDGYFEQLPTLLLIQAKPVDESAAVPEGYFDNLAGNIMARIRQEQSLQDAAYSEILNAVGNINVFSVPEGYFEGLATNILAKLDTGQSALLTGIGNKNVFTAPAGYFDNLADSIVSKLKNETVEQETATISELVTGIGNKNVFTVPQEYFDNIVSNVQSKINSPAKVVKMGVRKTILKYAAAAVVTGLIATGALFIYNNNKIDKPDTATAQLMAAAEKINKNNSFDKELNAISDEDIVNYLESKGQDVDAALVASLTDDDKKLPEAADYIVDETTLDNMLKELDLNN